MKIILLKEVKGLGEAGDLVEAKTGYARNYLLPKGDAIEATPGNMKRWKKEQAAREAKEETEYNEALELKKQIEEVTVELDGKAGEGGRLFGSITSKDIGDALKKQHQLTVDRRKIQLDDNIKALGVTQVDVRVYPEVIAKLKVNVKEK